MVGWRNAKNVSHFFLYCRVCKGVRQTHRNDILYLIIERDELWLFDELVLAQLVLLKKVCEFKGVATKVAGNFKDYILIPIHYDILSFGVGLSLVYGSDELHFLGEIREIADGI